uniref:Uncharacterized protein n=1 Tax=Tetranychus urticae TaxID=32264 RepID=T1KCI9_TETUR
MTAHERQVNQKTRIEAPSCVQKVLVLPFLYFIGSSNYRFMNGCFNE